MRKVKSAVSAVILAITALTTPGGVAAIDIFCPGHGGASADPQINTALGCVPVQTTAFVSWLLPYLFGVAGGIAFLKMVNGFVSIATSSGDPKAVAGAQEEITAAIIGLLVVVFSLFILRLITLKILVIPGIS